MAAFQEAQTELTDEGIQVVAASVDPQDKAAELQPAITAAAREAGLDKQLPADQFQGLVSQMTGLGSFTSGATTAFLVGSGMMLLASAIVWVFLDLPHEEMAQDVEEHPDAALHMG